MLHVWLGEGYWVHSLTHLLSVFAPYPSSPIPEMSYTTQPIRGAEKERDEERWKNGRQRDRGRERDSKVVGGAGRNASRRRRAWASWSYLHTPRPFTSPRGCVCVSVCCFYVPTCQSARAFVATYFPSHCRLARRRPCSCRKGTCVKRWSSFYVFHWMTVRRESMVQTGGSKRCHKHADKNNTTTGARREGQQPGNNQISNCIILFSWSGSLMKSNEQFTHFK